MTNSIDSQDFEWVKGGYSALTSQSGDTVVLKTNVTTDNPTSQPVFTSNASMFACLGRLANLFFYEEKGQFCMVIGEDENDCGGIAGFGASPEAAIDAFVEAWIGSSSPEKQIAIGWGIPYNELDECCLQEQFYICTGNSLYKSQLEMIQSIHANQNTVIVKPRRIFGVDTAIFGYLVERVVSSEPFTFTAVICCCNQDLVYEAATNLERMLRNASVIFSTAYNTEFQQAEFNIGPSRILISRVPSIDTRVVDLIYFSEAAFIPNLEELVSSIELKPDGKIVMASTQNWGKPNLFSDILLPENEGSDWDKVVLDWRDLHEVTGGDPNWGEMKRLMTGLSQSDWDKEYEPQIQFN